MRCTSAGFLLYLPLLLVSPAGQGLEALGEEEMAAETGAGIAIAFDDFQFAMAPTSYFEQVGSAPAGACTGTGSVSGNIQCWRRGDLRWYGINLSGAGAGSVGYQWNDSTSCTADSLSCPRGGTIANFSPYDNPYLIRSASPPGIAYNGDCVNGATAGCNAPASPATKAIYEFLAPTAQPTYTFSWWGEIESGSSRDSVTQPLATNAGSLLKSQSVIRGNAAGSVFRLFQFTQNGNQTFAMLYHSRLRGDYRFSLAQSGGSNAIGQVPLFASTEGLYFRNVDAFIPLGQLYYQALTVNQVGTNGNFEIALTPLPDVALVYDKHYAFNAGDSRGYETARANNTGGTNTADYDLTHGYARWGAWTATGAWLGRNLINGSDGSSTGDGVVFQGCGSCSLFYAFASRPITIDKRGDTYSRQQTQNYSCASGNSGIGCSTSSAGPISSGPGDASRSYPTAVVNLGDSRIEGLMFNSLRFQSCAAGGC